MCKERFLFVVGLLMLTPVLLVLVGCSQMSPQAVALSDLASQRVMAIEQSHEAFVQAYFQQSRERIDDFLMEKWIPVFLDQLVNGSTGTGEDLLTAIEAASPFDEDQKARLAAAFREQGIDDPGAALAAASQALGGGERGQVALDFSMSAVRQIEKKRRSLLDPVDELEKQTLQELRSSYQQLLRVQDSLTRHLRSLEAVQQEQDALLMRFGLLDERDRLVDRAIELNEDLTGVLDTGEGVAETLHQLERSLRNFGMAESSPGSGDSMPDDSMPDDSMTDDMDDSADDSTNDMNDKNDDSKEGEDDEQHP